MSSTLKIILPFWAIMLSCLCVNSCFSTQAKASEEEAAEQIDPVMLAHIPAISPVNPSYTVSSPFGLRSDPINKTSRFHKGMDFAMPVGTSLYATGDGVVEFVEKKRRSEAGFCLVIDHGYGYKTRYLHCSRILVAKGQEVLRGQMVAKSGNSGKRTTGAHLHYEVICNGAAENPAEYIKQMSSAEYASMVEGVKALIKEQNKASRAAKTPKTKPSQKVKSSDPDE